MAVITPIRTLRIAVLRCFTIPPQIAGERGQFDDIFATWIRRAVDLHNEKNNSKLKVEITGWNVIEKGQYPDVGNIDAIVVSGATASAYDDEPWIHKLSSFIQDVYQNYPSVKIYGGCFGHQIVSQALLGGFGAHVAANPMGWEIGVHEIKPSTEIMSAFPRLTKGEKISCQFLHRDHVVTEDAALPPTWIPFGKTALCEVQGFLNPGRVFTLQGHPEFDQFINRLSTASLESSGSVSAEDLRKFNELINQEDTADVFGEIFVDFMCQDV